MNTGIVTAGVVGASTGLRKHGVVGDTVNVAARLQSAAPVGCVLAGEETTRRLPPGTVAESVPPLELKGKERAGEAPTCSARFPRTERAAPDQIFGPTLELDARARAGR